MGAENERALKGCVRLAAYGGGVVLVGMLGYLGIEALQDRMDRAVQRNQPTLTSPTETESSAPRVLIETLPPPQNEALIWFPLNCNLENGMCSFVQAGTDRLLQTSDDIIIIEPVVDQSSIDTLNDQTPQSATPFRYVDGTLTPLDPNTEIPVPFK